MGATHALHMVTGEIVRESEFAGCRIRRAPECGGTHNLPLFYTAEKSRATEFTDVDMLILRDDQIRVIVEIEEVQFDPGLLFGKFVAPAVCWGYIYGPGGERAQMSERVAFIQIVSTSRLSHGSSKRQQLRYVEQAIRAMMPLEGSHITDYKLLCGNESEFSGAIGKELVAYIRDVLRT